KLHAIVSAVGQPGTEIALGKPAPPADLEHLVEIELVDREHDEDSDQPRDTDELPAKHCDVLVLQGAEEVVVPLIEEDIDVDHSEREGHHHEQEPPARPAVVREPVRAHDGPGVLKGSSQARSGRIFRTMGGTRPGSSRTGGGWFPIHQEPMEVSSSPSRGAGLDSITTSQGMLQ